MSGPEPHDFDALLAETFDHTRPSPHDSRGRAVVAALIGVGFLGVAVAAAAFIIPAVSTSGPVTAPVAPSTSTTTPVTPPPVPIPDSTSSRSARPAISGLADTAWTAVTARATGIPERAMRAYAGAAVRMTTERPACGIGWNTLAAIGLVESEHGTIHGGTIGDDGRALPQIVGIPLDGNGVNAIPDTDDGALDGDPHWDRAVGPMQFIPDTWRSYGADGDGDGIRDPDNIDDSTLAAARYLCTAGHDLTTDTGWIAAISAYNTSIDYNNRVAAAADAYAGMSQ
jgi:membrane-bound lytic murein transglycosylase B